jgi:hypothetical protein
MPLDKPTHLDSVVDSDKSLSPPRPVVLAEDLALPLEQLDLVLVRPPPNLPLHLDLVQVLPVPLQLDLEEPQEDLAPRQQQAPPVLDWVRLPQAVLGVSLVRPNPPPLPVLSLATLLQAPLRLEADSVQTRQPVDSEPQPPHRPDLAALGPSLPSVQVVSLATQQTHWEVPLVVSVVDWAARLAWAVKQGFRPLAPTCSSSLSRP